MTLSASLASALSGLNAAARGAETVSNNIANATTPGYGRRAVTLAANTLGGAGQGVMVTGVLRDVDTVLLGDRRRAEAQEAADAADAAAWRRIEAALGTAGTGTSLAARVDRLDAALVTAAGRPDSEAYLEGVLDAAAGLVATIRGAGAAVQTARTAADRAIAADVALLNASLSEVERINSQIRMIAATGRDPSALMDQRQAAIDRIAPIVPIRQVERPFGQVALFTPTGATLLDGRAVPFGFTGVGTVTATMTRAGGALSAVTQAGLTLEAGPGDPLAGGRLAANLALRDDGLPAAQAALDTLARDLVERFSDPAADPTLPAGAPGLFTDAGAAFNPALETGLAQRLAVNSLVDPAAGGALWRLRDGIGAPVPGPVGASTGLLRLGDAIAASRTVGVPPVPRALPALAAGVTAEVATRRIAAEDRAGFSGALAAALRDETAAGGVDTDRELQDMLRLERAYAANARVLQAVDRMLETLLGIRR